MLCGRCNWLCHPSNSKKSHRHEPLLDPPHFSILNDHSNWVNFTGLNLEAGKYHLHHVYLNVE